MANAEGRRNFEGIRALFAELEEQIQEVMAGASFTELLQLQGSIYIPVT